MHSSYNSIYDICKRETESLFATVGLFVTLQRCTCIVATSVRAQHIQDIWLTVRWEKSTGDTSAMCNMISKAALTDAKYAGVVLRLWVCSELGMLSERI
jgi:hypothetical protein